MYQTPTRDDFQRILVTIRQKAREQAHTEDQRIKAEHNSKGLGRSGPLIEAVARRFDELHAEATEKVMHLIRDFVERTQLTPMELAPSARMQLENLAAELVAGFPFLGETLQPATQQTQARYRGIFQQRLDEALRDIEIGFIGGRNMPGQPQKTIQANALRLLKAMEEATRGLSTPVIVTEQLPNLGMTGEEVKAAYNYLHTGGLIQSNFGLAFAAVITAKGHDALRDAKNTPDQTSPAFPEITYNYLHVETIIGSNVQQGATNSTITATQTITTGQIVERVRNLIGQVERALPTSDLLPETQERTRTTLAELRAATEEQTPDKGRIQRGLEALKRIMDYGGSYRTSRSCWRNQPNNAFASCRTGTLIRVVAETREIFHKPVTRLDIVSAI